MKGLTCWRVAVLLGSVLILVVTSTMASRNTADAMASAADRFIASLSLDQRREATFSFDSDDRERFHYVPTEMFPRNGLTVEAMNEDQRRAAHELLETGLSQAGYVAAVDIMALENVLAALEENPRFDRNPEWYYFSVFGTPSPDGIWGWRVEGHHLSVHFTMRDGFVIADAPTFFGTNPAEMPDGPNRGHRILAGVEDTARTLVMALSSSQRSTAVIDDVAPREIATEAFSQVHSLGPGGLKGSAMTEKQRILLRDVIASYASLMADELATSRLDQVEESGMEDVTFSWAGGIERGEKHYYRIQGPTFLIEYDNTQNDGNHVHSVWRDFQGDFGRDVLREHLRARRH